MFTQQKTILILCMVSLPSCFLSDKVHIKEYTLVERFAIQEWKNDFVNNKTCIIKLDFGSELTDIYFNLLSQEYNITIKDLSIDRTYKGLPDKEYVRIYNECSYHMYKKNLGKIFLRTLMQKQKKCMQKLSKSKKILHNFQKKGQSLFLMFNLILILASKVRKIFIFI